MAHGDGTLYSRRGFIAFRGGAGNVGGMIGGGVIRKDSFPHGLFGWGIIIEIDGDGVCGGIGDFWPVIRSIGYLRLNAPAVCLVL